MSDNIEEIDLIELFKKIYNEKFLIFKTSIFAAFFGIVFTLFQPDEFTSSTTFIPQLSSGVKASGGSSLMGLASLAGINIGSMESSSEFPPTLYPQVVEGVPFKIDLLSSEINYDNKSVLVRDYFLNKSKIDIPSIFSNSFKDSEQFPYKSEIYLITEEDKRMFEEIDNNLSLSINEKEGFITISFTDINKYVAAQITQIAQNLLQEKIIEFKNKSSKEMLDFALKQYSDKKEIYEKLQDERAIFIDKNINISSSLFQNKLSRIESEVNISESIVQQLASQVEQSKLQVNKDTPVFTTIKPVTVSYEKSAPKRSLIVILFILSGFIMSCGYVLLKDTFREILDSIKS